MCSDQGSSLCFRNDAGFSHLSDIGVVVEGILSKFIDHHPLAADIGRQ